MEVTGKIIIALPEVTGQSKAGRDWKKREYVLETNETFPKKIHFDFFGEKADQFPLNQGDTIRLSFDIESREYNGRWYTSIRGWKADKVEDPINGQGTVNTPGAPAGYGYPTAAPAAAPAAPAAPGGFPTPPMSAPQPNDDLPF